MKQNISTKDVRSKFDTIVKDKFCGDYEYARWHKSSLLEAGFDMTRQYIERKVLPRVLPYQNYLEIGPGPGTWTKLFLKENTGACYTLADISEEMLNLAKDNLGDYKNISFLRVDFLDFDSNEKFDLFFSSRALEYFSDKGKVIKKLAFLSKYGACGVIITKMPHYRRKLGRETSRLHTGQIHPNELKKLLENNGFEIIGLYSVTVNFPGLKSARVNRFLSRFCTGKKLNLLRAVLTESYSIIFKKI